MSRVFRLDGELVEITDDELTDMFRAEDKGYPTDLLSTIVNSCLMNVYVMSRASFDTAKDANQMLAAANEAQNTLREVLEYQMRIRLEELIAEKLEAAPKEQNITEDGDDQR